MSMLRALHYSARGQYLSFEHPQTGVPTNVIFNRYTEKSREGFLGSRHPEWTSYIVEIVLIDGTNQIEAAAREGVITLD